MRAGPKSVAPSSGKKRSRESPPRSSRAKRHNRGQPSGEQARRFEAWAHGQSPPPVQHGSKSPGSPPSERPARSCRQHGSPASPRPPTPARDAQYSAAKGAARGRRGAMLVTAAGGTAPPASASSPVGSKSPPGCAVFSPGSTAGMPSASGRGERSPPSPGRCNVAVYASSAAHRSTATVQAKLPADLAVLLRMFGEEADHCTGWRNIGTLTNGLLPGGLQVVSCLRRLTC